MASWTSDKKQQAAPRGLRRWIRDRRAAATRSRDAAADTPVGATPKQRA